MARKHGAKVNRKAKRRQTKRKQQRQANNDES
jgi:hypothetical protein